MYLVWKLVHKTKIIPYEEMVSAGHATTEGLASFYNYSFALITLAGL